MSERSRITDDPEWTRWVQVTRHAWDAEANWARSTLGLARTAVRGDLDPGAATRAYLTSTRREGERFWRTASRLGAQYVHDLTTLAGQVGAGVVDEVMKAQGRAGTGVDAHLLGPVDGSALATITVTNRHPRTRRIEISAGSVTDPAGAPVAELRLMAQPEHVTLASGAESTVELSVDLRGTRVAAGEHYLCTVSVTGGDEAVIPCRIDVI